MMPRNRSRAAGVVAGVAAQGLDEAGQRGQRRAQLVAGVGQEVGAGALGAAQLGLVAQGKQGQPAAFLASSGSARHPPDAVLYPAGW